MDLAGRDVDEVAGRRLERVLDAGRAVACSWPRRTGCRSTSRSRRGGGPGSGRRARSRRSTNTAAPTRPSAPRSRSSAPCPACWPIVVCRSAGEMRVGHRPMIRAGTIGRVPTWTPDPARFPRFALLDGPSPLAPLPRLSAALGGGTELWIKREDLLPLAFGGNKLRNLEFLVGAALAEGADMPRHVRPALVEPRPADRRGRRAGGPRGPPRPVRTAGRPAQSRASCSTSCSARRSTMPPRTTEPSARRSWSASWRSCGRPAGGRA